MKNTTYPQITTDTLQHIKNVLTPEGFTVDDLNPELQNVNPFVIVRKGDVRMHVNLPNPDSYSNKDRIKVSPSFHLDNPRVSLYDHRSWDHRQSGDSYHLQKEFTLSPTSSAKRLLKRFKQAVEDYTPVFKDALENYKNSVKAATEKMDSKLRLLDVVDLKYCNTEEEKIERLKTQNEFYLDNDYNNKITVFSANSVRIELSSLTMDQGIKLANFLKTL